MKKGFYKKLVLVASIFGIILFFFYFFKLNTYITLDRFKQNRELFIQMVHNRYVLSVFLYILLYAIGIALSFPSASLFTLVGGFLFGAIPGTIYSCIGATIGATIAFLLVRNVIGDHVQKKYTRQLQGFNASLEEDGISFLLFVRLVAIIPFFIINILAGFSNVSLWTFVWTTAVGIIPGSLVYSFAGEQLNAIDSVQDIFTVKIMIAFVLLSLLALIPILIKRITVKK